MEFMQKRACLSWDHFAHFLALIPLDASIASAKPSLVIHTFIHIVQRLQGFFINSRGGLFLFKFSQ